MDLKKLALWLLAVGTLALVVGSVIAVTTFDIQEFKEKILEKKMLYNKSGEYSCSEECSECLEEIKKDWLWEKA
jgi:hypothetical protein